MDLLKEFLYKVADDELILGHRNSEWTGLGPMLEEDIAFSSMAQDKIGHANALYNILYIELGEQQPDQIAFGRKEKDFKCCHLVEMPNGEYDFSLIRHFLFDHSELLRYTLLEQSSFAPLAQLAKKIKGELKYHVLHGDTWIKKLGKANEESHARMQSALNEAWPLALGIFEEGPYEVELISQGIFVGEATLKEQWLVSVSTILELANLKIPVNIEASLGGRRGYHTEHLAPLLKEMTEVFSLDPNAEW
ncbi:MAG: 1,2-phenylacetyl-CoA epoxidase subunit PaaC [Chitinophagales bacterium]|nr:1,2-phenylacetyl-CoA epoxidase subunit PaaC [Chitinophagales bacterium]